MCSITPLLSHQDTSSVKISLLELFFFLGWENALEGASRREQVIEKIQSASATEKAGTLKSDGIRSAKELFFSALVSSSLKWKK